MAGVNGRPGRRRFRATGWLLVLTLLALLPVPWLHVVDNDPPGMAWRLDGRLVVNDETMSPPGRWTWLTVGRPPHLVEVLGDWLVAGGDHTTDMRVAPAATRPAINEPMAAAIGLAEAGVAVDFDLLVEAVGPDDPRFGEQVRLTRIAGIELTDRDAWAAAQERIAAGAVVFETADGNVHVTDGPGLPFRRVDVVDLVRGVEAGIGGQLPDVAPVAWFRNLALGRSHGLMVALVTYAETSGEDLARGRHVAGTGGIDPDGTVRPIGGLRAKAAAARDAGADVLLFPAFQRDDLTAFEPGDMRLVPVDSLHDAIEALRG